MEEIGADYFEPIEQFIARETGLAEERVRHIQQIGEPWPIIQAFNEFLSRASQDAQATGTKFFDALIVNSQLVNEVGIGDLFSLLQPEILDAHVQRVAALTGEEEQMVEGVQLAVHDYLNMVIETVQEVARKKMQNTSAD